MPPIKLVPKWLFLAGYSSAPGHLFGSPCATSPLEEPGTEAFAARVTGPAFASFGEPGPAPDTLGGPL